MILEEDSCDLNSVFNESSSCSSTNNNTNKIKYSSNDCYSNPNKRMKLEDYYYYDDEEDEEDEALSIYEDDLDEFDIEFNKKTSKRQKQDFNSYLNLVNTTNQDETYQQMAFRHWRNALVETTFCSPFRSSTALKSSSSSSSSNSSQSNSLSSSPKLADQILIQSLEMINFKEEKLVENFEAILANKPLNKMFTYAFNQLNLNRKETFIYLIERNMSNKILSPFDQYAYVKLKNIKSFASLTNTNLINLNERYDFNYYNIKKLSKLMRTMSVHERNFLKQNNLMPSCVSSHLMPFFFDIFSMSDLKQIGDDTVNKMLGLKQAFKATQLYLDEHTLTSYLVENLLWNCLALFKFKLTDLVADSKTTRMGYFNFYLAFVYIQIHLEQTKDTFLVKRLNEYKQILSHLFDALVLTGMFAHGDYVRFRQFYEEKKKRFQCLENVYLENAIRSIAPTADVCFPLKLKNLCRIQIKKSLVNYNMDTLNKLNVPVSTRKFLLFSEEMEIIYSKKSH